VRKNSNAMKYNRSTLSSSTSTERKLWRAKLLNRMSEVIRKGSTNLHFFQRGTNHMKRGTKHMK